MGIGRCGLQLYQHLYLKGFFNNIGAILEFGDQEVKPKADTDLMVFLHSIGKGDPADIIKEAQLKLGRRPLGKKIFRPNNLPASLFYGWLGIKKYASIDSNGKKNSLIFDLNEDLGIKYNFNQEYDLVTNHGTIEHIFNQYACFKNMHDLTKNDGYMLHWLPFGGHINHCFFNYHPQFFIDLALANNYNIEGIWLDINDSLLIPYSKEALANLKKSGLNDAGIFCLFKKTRRQPFKTPFQGKYVEVTKVDAIKSIKFRKPNKSILRKILSKIMQMKL